MDGAALDDAAGPPRPMPTDPSPTDPSSAGTTPGGAVATSPPRSSDGTGRSRFAGIETTDILGVDVLALDEARALAIVDDAIADRRQLSIAFANANLLNFAAADESLREALSRFMVLNDGIGVDLARRMLEGHPFPANPNGTEFNPYIFEHSRHDLRVFFLGATEDMVRRAGAAIERDHPRHTMVGVQHGFAPPEEQGEIADRIASLDVDVLMVAMGNPRQEAWLAEYQERSGAIVGLGVGAMFDRFAGVVQRPPAIVLKLRVEWLYRLLREPRRLARRYLVGNGLFLWRVWKQKRTKPRSR